MPGDASRYRIARLLGRGGMAEVFEAFLEGEGGFERRVALKRVLADASGDPGFLESFGDEARIVSQLHHASIVGVFDYGLMDGLPFLVFELIDGLDVEALAERAVEEGGSVPPALALHIATEIAHALDYAHNAKDSRGKSMGIIHRDVSPENILVSWNGDVKLADFGIAFALRRIEATRAGTAKGKLSYMAPEQLRGDALDPRADLFALGCTLHRLLAGASPLAKTPPAIDPGLDADIRAILTRATEPAKERRYANAAEMAAACGRAMMKRLTDDARTSMREWIAGLRPQSEDAARLRRRPGVDLLDLDLIDLAGGEDAGLRRYESRARPDANLEPVEPVALVDPAEGPEETAATELTQAELVAFEENEVREHLIGAQIGSYRLDALLGSGMTARVYRATHLLLDRPVAIKVLHAKHARKQRLAVRIAREMKALARLQHPNLVAVIDAGTTPSGLPFLVMELAEGRTLSFTLRLEGPFAPERAASVARQIALGLAAAHEAGIVHRDLKPGNVMLVEEGGEERAKILDFGLSRSIRSDAPRTALTKAGDVLGTPAYMAPEQIADASSAGPPADLYALGVILYEMLAGRRPFSANIEEAIEQHLHAEPPLLPPAGGLERITHRLLSKYPRDRYPDAFAVIEAIDALAPAVPVLPPPSIDAPPIVVVQRDVHYARWIGVFALLVVAGLLVMLAVFLGRAKNDATAALTGLELAPAEPSLRETAPVAKPVALAREEAAPQNDAEPETAAKKKPRAASTPATAAALPVQASSPSLEELRRRLAAALAARRLTASDVESTDRGKESLAAFYAAESRSDAAAARAALDRALGAIAAHPISHRMLEDHLQRISRRLRDRAQALDPAALDRFERRYFALREALRPEPSETEAASLWEKIIALEDDVAKALGS